MRKPNCGWARAHRGACLAALAAGLGGCATPQYAVRPLPQPDESAEVVRIEREISAQQAQEFEEQAARLIMAGERLFGFDVPSILARLSRLTERPDLPYRAYLYRDDDPNAAALADGRVYLSTGMLRYLGERGSRAEELAFILSHELAHTVAQHLVKRYQTLAQQNAFLSLVAVGAAIATRGAGAGGQEAGRLALNVASLLSDVAVSGYSQEQELEADQLGIQYVIRGGYDPQGALDVLEDFTRFENPSPFFRTHPYIAERRAQLARYLAERQAAPSRTAEPSGVSAEQARAERVRHLRQIQRQYPEGSVSWRNLQRQIEALEWQAR